MRLNVLALSYLFPNPAQPEYGIFVHNRLKALTEFCNVKVIAPQQWFPFRNRIRGGVASDIPVPSRTSYKGIAVSYPRFPVIPRFFKIIDSISYLISIIPTVGRLKREGFNFDLVDAHWTYPDIVAAYCLAKTFGCPFLVTLRGREALYEGERGPRKRVLDALLRRADGVVALSSELRDLAIQIGVSPEKIRIVLNGVDVACFSPIGRDEARRNLGVSTGKKVLLSVGSLIRRKGHHHIIAMLPEIMQREDVELYIVGSVNPEGDFSQNLQSLVKRMGLSNVHFVDKVDHDRLRDWYCAADLFCLATEGEGCPNVVLEAMATGTPVVVTNVGAVRDIVAEGEDGFVANSLPEMKVQIARALSHEWDRGGIACRMRERSWRRCAEQVLETYVSVLNDRTAGFSCKGGSR